MSFTIPGKTFLVGEYSALVGGSILGLATGTGFSVNYENVANAAQDFSMQSPAGLLIQENSSSFKNTKISIQDGFAPYGGFGKSTAEYLSAVMRLAHPHQDLDFAGLRLAYKSHSLKSGAEVSGLDLAIPYFGQVTHFDSEGEKFSARPWAYPNYDFILISTGHKVKTHEHIQTLNPATLMALKPVSELVVKSYFKNDMHEFIIGLNTWSGVLEKNGFLTPASRELKSSLQKNKDILCVKPCGAMGADVILVLCELTKSEEVQKQISGMNLLIQATSKNLLPGVNGLIEKKSDAVKAGIYVD